MDQWKSRDFEERISGNIRRWHEQTDKYGGHREVGGTCHAGDGFMGLNWEWEEETVEGRYQNFEYYSAML